MPVKRRVCTFTHVGSQAIISISFFDKPTQQTALCMLLVVESKAQAIHWLVPGHTDQRGQNKSGRSVLPCSSCVYCQCLVLSSKGRYSLLSELSRGNGNVAQQLCANKMFHWSINRGAAHVILFPGLQSKIEVNKIILKKRPTKLTIKLVQILGWCTGVFFFQEKKPLHLLPVDIFISFTWRKSVFWYKKVQTTTRIISVYLK